MLTYQNICGKKGVIFVNMHFVSFGRIVVATCFPSVPHRLIYGTESTIHWTNIYLRVWIYMYIKSYLVTMTIFSPLCEWISPKDKYTSHCHSFNIYKAYRIKMRIIWVCYNQGDTWYRNTEGIDKFYKLPKEFGYIPRLLAPKGDFDVLTLNERIPIGLVRHTRFLLTVFVLSFLLLFIILFISLTILLCFH